MSDITDTTIHQSVIVDAPLELAFTTFVERFDEVKPREHSILPVPIERTVFEPFVGGHIYDIATDGTRCDWARVLVFEPPTRVVFSWDISPSWQLETDLQHASEVEVRWSAETPERTRVELEHRNLERHGPAWSALRDGVAGDGGWPLYLRRYSAIVK